jgi:outer membrane protein
MRTIIYSALASAALLTAGAAPAQRIGGAVVAVVDTGRVLRECTACVAATGQLQTQITALQQRAQQLGTPLQTEAQSIEQAAEALRAQAAGAARTQAETALQTRVRALQTQQNTANQEIARSEQNIQSIRAHVAQQLNTRIDTIVGEVMTARGANLVVDTGATLAHASSLDVTNDVLTRLNQQLPSVSVTPLPQQPQPAQQQPQGR